MTYFCQEAQIPGLNTPPAMISTPMVDYSLVGEKMQFQPLEVIFMIDEDMTNYIALHNWMIALGFPEDHQQYTDFITEFAFETKSELLRTTSPGTLEILNSSNNSVAVIAYDGLHPTSIQPIQMQSTTTDTMYLMCSATFEYTHYKFVDRN